MDTWSHQKGLGVIVLQFKCLVNRCTFISVISKISRTYYLRRLLLKLDTLPRSHLLLVEFFIQRVRCIATPPPYCTPRPPSLMPCLLQDIASRWYHRSICLVLIIVVYITTEWLIRRMFTSNLQNGRNNHPCLQFRVPNDIDESSRLT